MATGAPHMPAPFKLDERVTPVTQKTLLANNRDAQPQVTMRDSGHQQRGQTFLKRLQSSGHAEWFWKVPNFTHVNHFTAHGILDVFNTNECSNKPRMNTMNGTSKLGVYRGTFL